MEVILRACCWTCLTRTGPAYYVADMCSSSSRQSLRWCRRATAAIKNRLTSTRCLSTSSGFPHATTRNNTRLRTIKVWVRRLRRKCMNIFSKLIHIRSSFPSTGRRQRGWTLLLIRKWPTTGRNGSEIVTRTLISTPSQRKSQFRTS